MGLSKKSKWDQCIHIRHTTYFDFVFNLGDFSCITSMSSLLGCRFLLGIDSWNGNIWHNEIIFNYKNDWLKLNRRAQTHTRASVDTHTNGMQTYRKDTLVNLWLTSDSFAGDGGGGPAPFGIFGFRTRLLSTSDVWICTGGASDERFWDDVWSGGIPTLSFTNEKSPMSKFWTFNARNSSIISDLVRNFLPRGEW